MTSIKHGDIHLQNPPPLQHLGSLTHIKSSEGNFFTYAVSTDNSQDLILYASSQSDGTMDFLLEGENGGSSRESVANLLDEGLGTSLDGTDEISSIHSTLGRNDSGVFSSDETTSLAGSQSQLTLSTTTSTTTTAAGAENPALPPIHPSDSAVSPKKHRPKNSSPNRQGPQRCAICGKVFSNASALTKHKLTHSDERKHACSLCGKAFKRQDHLNGHMLTHRNKKPFECTAKGCGKSYCDARSLRRHVDTRHVQNTLTSVTQSIAAQVQLENGPHTSPTNTHTQIIQDNPPTSIHCNGHAHGHPHVNNVKVKVLVTGDSNSQHENGQILMDTSDMAKILGLDTTQLIDSHVVLENPRGVGVGGSNSNSPCLEEKLVLVKIEAQPQQQIQEEDTFTTIPMQMHSNGSVNVKIEPGTEVSLAMDANSKPTESSKEFKKCTMRTSQSQLHQLLTQRANKASFSPYSNMNSSNQNQNLTKTSPLKGGPSGATTNCGYDINWTVKSEVCDNVNEMRSVPTGPGGGNVGNCGRKIGSKDTVTTSTSTVTPRGNNKSSINSLTANANVIGGNSPTLLKEQLELIHQIIQQAQQESSHFAAAAASGTGKSSKGGSKKSKSAAVAFATAVSSAALMNGKSEGESTPAGCGSQGKSGAEDKPVECTICFRRFKNTPALNGHFRIHGGIVKDTDGKRRDTSSKDSTNIHLQTGQSTQPSPGVSKRVRALIEEKIIQKRNTTGNTQGIERNVNQVSSSSSALTLGGQNGFVETLVSLSSVPQDSLSLNTNGLHLSSTNLLAQQLTFTTGTGNPSNPLETRQTETPPQSFQFVYSDDTDNADYLLMEEEVFNKVSSICPDSFLNGIDESILSVTAVGNDELGPEWSWTEQSSTPGPDSVNSRLNSFFTASTPEEHQQFNKLEGGGGPFTPLPPLDPVFYTSPTPQSPSFSQDSPSFIYPTPPASLESHNALQSPLFPFPVTTSTPSQIPSSATTTLIFPFETQTNFNAIANTLITCTNNNNAAADVNSLSANNNSISTAANPNDGPMDTIFSTSSTNTNTSTTSIGTGYSTTASGELLLHTNLVRHFGSVKARNHSGGSTVSDLHLDFLTPSSSPSLVGCSSSSSTEDSVQSMKELKINEPSRMDCSEEDIFLNPNSVPNSPCIKSPKRKQIRNTFASNLRPHPTHLTTGGVSSNTHFTPYPILSPVRSAPGLYWAFSTKLSHVDDAKKETPRINIGSNFQAKLPICSPCIYNAAGDVNVTEPELEDFMWDPKVMEISSDEEVDKYLEFACCTAIPGGGRNKEYALHLLRLCDGDINEAIILLMNPAPFLPEYLRCNYPENAKWSREEINSFQDALLRHGKDFVEVAKEIRSKRSEDCVIFYQLWKKVCSIEYEKIRTIWKKRDGAFTLDLLKNVPPPLVTLTHRHSHIHAGSMSSILELSEAKNKVPVKIQDSPSPVCDSLRAHTSHVHTREEFPCKICGKIWRKVKSRSAHMKSHRPPEQCENNNIPTKKSKYQHHPHVSPLTTSASMTSISASRTDSLSSVNSLNASPLPISQAATATPTTTSAAASSTAKSSSGNSRDT